MTDIEGATPVTRKTPTWLAFFPLTNYKAKKIPQADKLTNFQAVILIFCFGVDLFLWALGLTVALFVAVPTVLVGLLAVGLLAVLVIVGLIGLIIGVVVILFAIGLCCLPILIVVSIVLTVICAPLSLLTILCCPCIFCGVITAGIVMIITDA